MKDFKDTEEHSEFQNMKKISLFYVFGCLNPDPQNQLNPNPDRLPPSAQRRILITVSPRADLFFINS